MNIYICIYTLSRRAVGSVIEPIKSLAAVAKVSVYVYIYIYI
jgi:hypothetical protein